MPTTQRLMTDTTGQDIVQAIEDLSIAVKPNATDIHMSSSDSTSVAQKIDNEIATVANGIAIVAEGDVHAAIAKDQFVYVRNHSTLAQGVYKATVAIGTNAALSTSNLTLDNGGGLNDLQAQITTLNSKTFPIADNIDSFISLFQSDTVVHTVRIASGTLATTLYGNTHSGACTGFRVEDYIIYSAFDSDGLSVTGWVTISQRTASFSRPIKYADYSGEFAITTLDDGVYYKEVSRDVLGIPNNATLLFAQFTSGFSSSEILSITSNSTKLFIMAKTSRTVTRAIRVFYLG